MKVLTMKLLSSFALICVSVFAISFAVAQQMTFEEADLNGDGTVNKEEAASVETLLEQFDVADINQDGMLDKDEYAVIIKAE